ncbi:nitrite reductase [Psychrobacillus sp. FSL H8-0484]|uniref:nitrite reductase n=1 Tax=Psychrobacillus sp. FSL H8-0484 TaxID=2921390 RepID=UPI0030F7DB8C
MKKVWRWIGSFFIILFGVFLSLSSSTNLFTFGSISLNTVKIEKNIERLKAFSWFNELYEKEEHRRSFFMSLKVRRYLESSIRVSRLIRSEREKERLILLLEEVARLRNKA